MSDKKFTVQWPSRMTRAFWTLNNEMNPANKATFVREIDAVPMDSLRAAIMEKHGIKPSYTALVVKAATIALQEFPYANRAIIGPPLFKRLIQFTTTDITVAIERDVPNAESIVLADTIPHTSMMNLKEITLALQRFSQATTENNQRWRLFSSLLTKIPVFLSRWIIGMPRFSANMWAQHRGGACFVNSPAKYGIDLIVADMIWPVTLVFGWVRERPFVCNSELVVRRTMPLSLIFDRRIMAGAPAAKFFNRLAELLEKAEELQEP
ncbi:MAG TPA: dehydrogenase [Bdellovibrionales bacterium]|nr:MAG: dehydrogenase [Bdellovibrionales bacterium GWB1_52_6]OFZ06053.1 MAG: dehydrogenase [Bdellovibrionales bacterium GWA1_52_35]OFZ37067.1 MAG: dehydrogenase [Bdellovibrionales bacterium GWC1_52_8]HAR44331.1 dehydrogenase [Bdellovibrionales bacterium]HCM39321.1 dehydrogenase [Bdellovibrionales bacterium]